MSTSMRQAAPTTRRRRPWTAAEKTAVLRAFAASGQSATAFCREHEVPRATLTLWRRTAGALPASAPPTGDAAPFARVELVTPPAPSEAPAPGVSAPAALAPLTLALRTPDGLEVAVTGLDATTAVAVLRGVLAPLPTRRAGAA
jgi:transposase-like protein